MGKELKKNNVNKIYYFGFFVYILGILYITLFSRVIISVPSNTLLFSSYRKCFEGNWQIGLQILLNAILFVPMGIFVPLLLEQNLCSNKKVLLFSCLFGITFSVIIELCQKIFLLGTFEYDDMFNNTLGAGIGAFIYMRLKTHSRIRTVFLLLIMVGTVSACVYTRYRNEKDKNIYLLNNIAFQIDKIEIIENNLVLSGFLFPYNFDLNENTNQNVSIYLVNDDYFVKTNTLYGIERTDVNNYYYNGYDYTNSGFISKIDLTKLKNENDYKIYFCLKGTKRLYSGVTIVKKGNEYEISITENKIDFAGTELGTLLNNSQLKAAVNNVVYVFQKNNELMIIADRDFPFETNSRTRIEYQPYTTQPDKLPQNRYRQGYVFDNIAFIFEQNEITQEIECGRYRVSKVKLPTGYSIKYVLLGYYPDGNENWKVVFRPTCLF